MQELDKNHAQLFRSLTAEPGQRFSAPVHAAYLKQLQLKSRYFLLPIVKPLSLLLIFVIRMIKRILPFQFSHHKLMGTLCVWFISRFMSHDTGWLFVRHFTLETQLLNFVLANGVNPYLPVDEQREVTLKPVSLSGVGNDVILQHDKNMYAFIEHLGNAAQKVRINQQLSPEQLDFSMLTVPDIDTLPNKKRWLHLDFETAFYLMTIMFCLLTTEQEYEMAINSFNLDQPLMQYIADITNDKTFLEFVPENSKHLYKITYHRDVVQELLEHSFVHEYAFTRLERLADLNQTG